MFPNTLVTTTSRCQKGGSHPPVPQVRHIYKHERTTNRHIAMTFFSRDGNYSHGGPSPRDGVPSPPSLQPHWTRVEQLLTGAGRIMSEMLVDCTTTVSAFMAVQLDRMANRTMSCSSKVYLKTIKR